MLLINETFDGLAWLCFLIYQPNPVYIWFLSEQFIGNILNEPELCSQTVKRFHILLSNTNNSI